MLYPILFCISIYLSCAIDSKPTLPNNELIPAKPNPEFSAALTTSSLRFDCGSFNDASNVALQFLHFNFISEQTPSIVSVIVVTALKLHRKLCNENFWSCSNRKRISAILRFCGSSRLSKGSGSILAIVSSFSASGKNSFGDNSGNNDFLSGIKNYFTNNRKT